MKKKQTATNESLLSTVKPSRAIVELAIPATLALLAKAVYNIVDTAYIGMLKDDIALTAVGVTVPLLLIMVSIENIFAAGAAVLAGRQLGSKDTAGASRTVTTVIGLSVGIGIVLCVGGGRYEPDRPVTRQAFAAMLYRWMGSPWAADGGLMYCGDRNQAATWAIEGLN